jgi:glycosyltransferase involved in cell wall biosynthesis
VSPTEVAVNLLWLAPGRVGGSEQYLTRQLAGLPASSDLSVTLLVQHRFADAHPELSRRYPTVTMPLTRDWRGARLLAEHTWLARRTRSAAVVHHGGGTVPLRGPGSVVLTVHDLQYLTFPENFSRPRLAYLRAMMPRSIARASVITTPSWYVRGTVIDAFGIDAERVVVVPHGVPDGVDPTSDDIDRIRARLAIAGRYLVYPAITHPHKGHVLLIEMLRHLDDIALVLVGGTGAAEPELQAAIAAARLGDRVIRTGRVDDATRDAIVAGADALVFPSEYEGFGAPLVEAMDLGTPVVCSAAPAVREVVADAAVVVPEASGPAWAAAVTAALGRRQQLIDAGRARRQVYTPEASGAALADAYRVAGGERQRWT